MRSNPCIKTGCNVFLMEYGKWFRCDVFAIEGVVIFNGFEEDRMVYNPATDIDITVHNTNFDTYAREGTLVTHRNNLIFHNPEIEHEVYRYD